MNEIPISVNVPPDGMLNPEEDIWRKEHRTTGPDLEVPEHIDIGSGVKRDFSFSYHSSVHDVVYEEQAKINAIAKAREWDEKVAKEKRPEPRKKWLQFQRGHEKDAAKAARNAKLHREAATTTLESLRTVVEHEVASQRQAHWGDPEVPDLGLDFSEFEGMPGLAILAWAGANWIKKTISKFRGRSSE